MSQPPPLSPFLKAYYKWKSIRFPWRRQYLVGLDLKNNTFWEFLDRGTSPKTTPSHLWRRIVYPPPSAKIHPSEIQISPAWHQWLRHTRNDPPSLTEQTQDVLRQERMKILAAQADARWAAKPGYVDAPSESKEIRKPQLVGGGMLEKEEQGQNGGAVVVEGKEEGEVLKEQRQKAWKEMKESQGKIPAQKDPWKRAAAGGPSEEWQPKAWTPGKK
ncbi:NADH-ubiquinone oxidoreductase assembly factor N7BML [Podospora fimiseda]|uniref:NADH-ubiquinone oxidoreductase assembly factor N7BML n=1 Tax=Podospora fimiseda TaxID=252190 RepID=A0AAN7BZ30_9PEZI|nr:NADH-ubiquinone oxidoreductase assembly factor N7BML [Podospora fimiseda]